MPDISLDFDKVEAEMISTLKDFQLATVNRIDELYRSGQKRVLVSDEVGLGKTLIARGMVAKVARLRQEEGDKLVKVVYICSNAAIAGQNLNKLRISKEIKTENTGSSRLSMQHLRIFQQENDTAILKNLIQLIPLTPDTSFRMTSGTGSVEERALMFAMLHRIPELKAHIQALEVAMTDFAYTAWKYAKNNWEKAVTDCDKKSNGKYLACVLSEVKLRLLEVHQNESEYLYQLIDLCDIISANEYKRVKETSIIGKLRVLFAQISIDLLQPDFVIMDEFQRFKFLIDSDADTETGMLAKRFFSGDNVRMLMLSATPYKMYSTLEEINVAQLDEHYSEFFKVMDFLIPKQDDRNQFHEIWNNYSVALREMTKGDNTFLQVKKVAEDAMYGSICRTERFAVNRCADLVDDSSVRMPLKVTAQDIKSYIQAQQLLEKINAGCKIPVDYIKSSPYILSFMRDYQLKHIVEKYFKLHPEELNKANKECLWLKRNQIDSYEKLDSGNARLEFVKNHAFMHRAENLLWVPPSVPYYELNGPYKEAETFSKMIVFSSWEMVPRMVASMLSYEAERKTIEVLARRSRQDQQDVKYFSTGNNRYPPAKLNFAVSLGDPKAMSLFCLLYPSEFLASCFVAIDALNRRLTLKQIEKEIKLRISEKLDAISSKKTLFGREDDRWYYIAPLLMDSKKYRDKWLKSGASLAVYKDVDEDKDVKKQKGFLTHLKKLNALIEMEDLRLGKRPEDLLDVLTNMTLSSPAICIYRTYRSQIGNSDSFQIDLPSQVAKVFINRMNTPESTAVIEACYGKSEDAHWKNILSYCKDGNLQSVCDEYAHMLVESNGLNKSEQRITILHNLVMESMNVRTAFYNVDTFNNFKNRMEGTKAKVVNLRSHFAVAFTKGDVNTNKDVDRKKTVRNSFNSPFRPFVLATTSIGQEGLDFHYYCRKIVHWNLPSNPIDLEQREGRINRYKCLAIRQNVANRYGDIQYEKDVWVDLFKAAVKKEKIAGNSELVPYWSLLDSEKMIKIERIVPMYPFSRDLSAYERLVKILSLYRLTLGQARQEELLEYLFKNFDKNDDFTEIFINLSPFYRGIKTR